MSVGTSLRKYRPYTVTITQNLELGQEIITTQYDDGEVHTVTRGLLHGPNPPKVYRIRSWSEGTECLPYIEDDRWKLHYTYGEVHPWIERIKPDFHLQLVVNQHGWVADKESLRPELIKALRVWHTKLTEDLADAESALTAAIFNKPI